MSSRYPIHKDWCHVSHDGPCLREDQSALSTFAMQHTINALRARLAAKEDELRDIRKLVREVADLNAPDVRAWHRAYPRIVTGCDFEELKAIAREYYAEVESLAAKAT